MTYGTLSGGYPGTSKFLHWLVALSVLSTIPLAFLMRQVPAGPLQDNLYNSHKSLGVLIFVLMILRLINRLVNGAPAPEPTLKRWERALSSAVHGLLYLLLLVLPIVGYVANSVYGATTPFFGLFELPPIMAQDEARAERLFTLHRRLGWLVAILAGMHIAAGLQHYFIRRDGVLQRMLPRALGGA